MVWIFLYLVLGGIHRASSLGECQLSDEDLSITLNRDNIHSPEYPKPFRADQFCEWKFVRPLKPTESMFLYLKEIQFIENSRNITADLRIGEEDFLSQKPRADCRLYGKKMTSIDIGKLTTYMESMHENFGRFCAAWHIDERIPKNIRFRAQANTTDKQRFGKKFFIKYQLIDVSLIENTSTITSAPSSYATTMHSTTTTITSVNDEKPQQPSKQQECSNGSMIAIIILAGVLGISWVLLAYVCYRGWKYSGFSKQRSLQNVSMVAQCQSTMIEPAYAAYESTTSGDISPYGSSNPQQPAYPMYDIPTNNRLRGQTIQSANSTASEQHYQSPNSLVALEQETQEQTSSSNVKDVYSVVDKAKKTKQTE